MIFQDTIKKLILWYFFPIKLNNKKLFVVTNFIRFFHTLSRGFEK